MSGKFIITLTGIGQSYRLDIIKKASPDILKDYLIIFTDRHSYNLYTEHHNDFNFVIMDDYRKDYPFSFDHELLLETTSEEEYWKQLKTFYSPADKRFYSYDIHRFILPYLAEHNILNFALIDSDVILSNDRNALEKFFLNTTPGLMYAPFMAPEYRQERMDFFKKEIQPLFPQINFDLTFVQGADGYIRGFHFHNKEELMLFFNIWNKATEILFTNPNYNNFIFGSLIVDFCFLCPLIINYFGKIGYTFRNGLDLSYIDGVTIFKHVSRPEDTFYTRHRDHVWNYYKFDYNDITTVSSFIKKNKSQLQTYYGGAFRSIEITDTHVYTII